MSRNGKNYVSGWIRKEKRQKIYTRDNHTCLYCGDSIYDTAGLVLTLDHVVAKELGGTNAHTNLVTACRSCNCSKQDKPLRGAKGFLMFLQDRGIDTTKIEKNVKNALRRKLK